MQLKRFSQNFFAPALVIALAGAAPLAKPATAQAATPDEMGLEVQQVTETSDQSPSPTSGLLIKSVEGIAAESGLQVGDIITSVESLEELERKTTAAAAEVDEGSTFRFELEVMRGGQELKVSLTLTGTKPVEPVPGDDEPTNGDQAEEDTQDYSPIDATTPESNGSPLSEDAASGPAEDDTLGEDEGDASDTLDAQETTVAAPTVSYTAHVQNIGWQGAVQDGAVAGTTGRSLRVEGLTARVSGVKGLGIEYRTHVQNIGWQGWVANGAQAGTTGQSLRLEALCMRLTGAAADQYDLYYRVHAQNVGWMGWARNGEASGTAGMSYRLEGVQIRVVPKGTAAPSAAGQNEAMPFLGTLTLQAHVQNQGWLATVHDPAAAGTTGKSQRMEALRISVDSGATAGSVSGGITYQAHVQNIGWQDWRSNGQVAGTTGQSLRVEAIRMNLTGDMANKYDLYYRMHVANIGWLTWAENGATAGTSGMSRAVESVEVRLVPKGTAAPSSNGAALNTSYIADHNVAYSTYVHGQGWTGESSEGTMSGTTGQSRAVDGMRARIVAPGEGALSGGIEYRTHVANVGWTGYVSGNAATGSATSGNQSEAIQMRLTGTLATQFDVWYRVHVQNHGWLGWASNGATAGSTGAGLRIEAVEVQVRAKGTGAPGSTANASFVGTQGWQNPSWMYQVSANTVHSWWTQGYGKFSYVTPSRISANATRDEVVNAFVSRAWEYVGSPYVWDYACAPGVGVDCAGLVLQCGYAVGMDFGDMNPYNHYYGGGWHAAYANALWDSSHVQRTGLGSERPGDLISYPGHVAIYVGNGRMIEAYDASRGVIVSSRRYDKARGVIRLFS